MSVELAAAFSALGGAARRAARAIQKLAASTRWMQAREMQLEGKSVAEIAKATGISKRKLYKHWRHGRG